MLATIDKEPIARKLLTHRGLPAEPSRFEQARVTQGSLWSTEPPDADAPEPRGDDLDQRRADDLLPE